MIQQPVYYPFFATVKDNNRKLVNNALVLDSKTQKYKIDFEDFEKKIVENGVKLFLLCSPHNPVGRVWQKEELEKMGQICLKHGVIILSDEIHADFIFTSSKHHVFTSVNPAFLDNSIVCLSPSKTFNLAGLQFSDVLIANADLRAKFTTAYDKSGYSQLNTLGIVAAHAAYEHGADWVDELLVYLEENVLVIEEFLRANMPKVKLIKPEGTYLAWLDFRELGLSQKELDERVANDAKLWLSSGTVFGKEGEGFQRVNFACPREELKKALNKLSKIYY